MPERRGGIRPGTLLEKELLALVCKRFQMVLSLKLSHIQRWQLLFCG
jgi:hypothetical protein